jgi:hypothetical protein
VCSGLTDSGCLVVALRLATLTKDSWHNERWSFRASATLRASG